MSEQPYARDEYEVRLSKRGHLAHVSRTALGILGRGSCSGHLHIPSTVGTGLSAHSYLYIVTLEGYQKIQRYFGSSQVVPIYIEVEDGERLLRAIARERQQKTPQYEEMCRRFLADAADFSEEKLTEAGITRRFINKDMEGTIREITEYIRRDMSGMEK